MEDFFKRFSEDNYYTDEEIYYRVKSSGKYDEILKYIMDARVKLGNETSFTSQDGKKFHYYIRNILKSNITELEANSRMNLAESANKRLVKSVYRESLIDEAMSSSAIEGAFSTRRRTEELVEKGSEPINKDEKMILNNYEALEFINTNSHKEINDDLILELHNIITKGTLENEDITIRFRDGYVGVNDGNNHIIYKAPDSELVEELMLNLIEYINSDIEENVFVKASIIQFMFLYIHPFFDGNGRTARALTYMYLIKNGYEFFKFFSISYVVNDYKKNYYKSILKCENEYSDLTYFIDFNINMMLEAVNKTVEKYNNEYLTMEVQKYIKQHRIYLTKDQVEFLDKFLKMADKQLNLKKYIKITGLAESTSKKHLQIFIKSGIFKKIILNRETYYIINDLNYFLEMNNKFSGAINKEM